MKIKIFDMSASGEGIGKTESGKIVFVPGALIGDEITAEITEDKSSFAKARLISVDILSPFRCEPSAAGANCGRCGGCPLIELEYSAQLDWKERHVRDCLTRIGGFAAPFIRPIKGMEKPYEYRNKAEFAVDGNKVGYMQAKSHRLIDCEGCRIQNPKAMEIAAEYAGSPLKNARQLIVRTAVTGEHMAYSVTKTGYAKLFSGSNLIHDEIRTDMEILKVEVGPVSFYQVNPVQTSVLYSQVQKYADLSGSETVLDLYCGAGSIGLSMAGHCRRIIGVESVKEAVIEANRNAVINGIVNATFVHGKAEKAVEEKLQGVSADVVILDPPRAGCREDLLETVMKIGAPKLIYVSCNPATLARDLKILCGERQLPDGSGLTGYKLIEAAPVDMFPHTMHVEVVVLLSRV